MAHVLFFRILGKEFNNSINPFTPKNDQFQISSAASPEISHYTVMKDLILHCLCSSFSVKDDDSILPILTTPPIQNSFRKVGRTFVFFDLGVKGLMFRFFTHSLL